jgi:hypothetical protein
MSDYSNSDSTAIFGFLHPAQITTLIDILNHTTLRQTAFVESVYNERARHFQETVKFLKAIGWVYETGNALELTTAARFRIQNTQQFQADGTLIESVAEISSPYQAILSDYLVQFHTDSGRILYQPSAQSRSKQSGIRNFLIELGVVSHQTQDDSYVLNDKFAHLFLWSRNIHGVTSKAELLLRASQKDELGTSAEIAVLEFEKKRVGSDWCTHVKHISAKNPGACFDITSVTVDGGFIVPRFIEVKAVSADSYQFFWTAAEVEAALLLQQSYFLYLIPVLGGGTFDVSKIEIIKNPHVAVYQNPDAWLKDENVIVCRRRSTPKNS